MKTKRPRLRVVTASFDDLAKQAILSAHPDLLERLSANTCGEAPPSFNRFEHIDNVALTVLRFKGFA